MANASLSLAETHRHQPPRQVGRNSPYGEQALVLLESLAKEKQLDTMAYAQLFADTFGGDWHVEKKGYRDASCKGGPASLLCANDDDNSGGRASRPSQLAR